MKHPALVGRVLMMGTPRPGGQDVDDGTPRPGGQGVDDEAPRPGGQGVDDWLVEALRPGGQGNDDGTPRHGGQVVQGSMTGHPALVGRALMMGHPVALNLQCGRLVGALYVILLLKEAVLSRQ